MAATGYGARTLVGFEVRGPSLRRIAATIQAHLLWRGRCRRRFPPFWRVRRNYPYKGSSDGLTRDLRMKL
jgi:hypothetical protein